LTDEQTPGEPTPDEEPATPAAEGQSDEQSAQAGSAADPPTADQPPEEATDQEPVAEEQPPAESEDVAAEPEVEPEPEPEAEAEAPAAEAPAESESAGTAEEPADAPSAPEPQAEESAPAGEAAGEAAAPAGETAEPASEAAEPAGEAAKPAPPEEIVDEQPRVKPEIPGADLELIVPEEERRYVDAEAQAAAEAEAEAEAARLRAEAEDIHSKPIADAAIDLAAGARYTATGKRKTAVARVILKPGSGTYLINDKELNDFFPRDTLQRMIRQPLESVGYDARMDVVARMHGGGVAAQAGALRHGISRALIEADPNLRGELKRRGFLTRDPRVKERKKAGLKKARKRPQFSKR
jgi:small subunit ribosomal protein S9